MRADDQVKKNGVAVDAEVFDAGLQLFLARLPRQ
jgi:hypothetical protein